MCGRFALYATEAEILQHFQLQAGFSMRPRYNIAPTQTVPVIMQWGTQVDFCRWGFIAPWVKSLDETPAGHTNARQETLEHKPTFKGALKKQRCLILASGYYEWCNFAGKKQPYFVYLKESPLFAFAGLWSRWISAQGLEINTCTIITTAAPTFLHKLHERMPVILNAQSSRRWLAKESLDELKSASATLTQESLGVHPVSTQMNNPRFEGVEAIYAL